MTVRLVHRPTRITRPISPSEEEQISPPPQLADGRLGGGFPVQALLPVIGALTSVVMIVVYRGSSNPLFLLVGAVLLVVALVGALVMALSQRGNAARQRRNQRERYLDFLERLRARMRTRQREVRAAAAVLDPEPAALLELVQDPARLWERRRSHDDFLRVRIGEGDLDWFPLTVPDDPNPVQPFDPIMVREAETVSDQLSVVHGMPISVALDRAGSVAVVGDRADTLKVARSMMLQLAALHSPDDVHIAAAFPAERAADWRGVDLLPHCIDDGLFDGPVPARRVASSAHGLISVLGAELGDRAQLAATAKRSVGSTARADNSRLVVFLDDHGHVASSIPVPDADLSLVDLQVTTVHLLSSRLDEPSDVTLRITVADGRATITDARVERDGQVVVQSAGLDATGPELFDAVARTLTPLRLSLTRQDAVESAEAVQITDLLGIDDITALNPATSWRPRSPRDFLRVPLGLDDFGAPVLLDLKESAQLGMGPHGICIGATGSGKSELLRTLVLGLALSHSPEDLSMVLVDYKGGAAFAPFRALPHVAGIIDNLADDAQLTERARVSIQGEVVRRQEMLRDADSSPSITHYRELRRERPELPPMPHLLLVIDEFGELLTAEPEFVDLLLTIGRIGRSIGIHLLLSSQRIEAGKLRGLDTYLSYRIGLRTFSEAESAIVLDRPDAFHLPAIPGFAYLKVDTSVYRRFRAGYVSGPVPSAMARALEPQDDRPRPLLLPLYNGIATPDDESDGSEQELERPSVGRALLDEAVDRLLGGGSPVAPVWLPPLPDRIPLSRVLGGEERGDLRVPLGLLDDPVHQRQTPWLLDLTRSGGHVAVIGAPQSGRSTLLRSLAASLALTHTPRQVSVYGMDLTGGGLTRLEGFPHVGGVATRASKDRLARLLEELTAMLRTRETVFRDLGIDSLAMLRSLHAEGRVPQLIAADIVLLVDGMAQLRQDFEELETALLELLQRGGGFGIHVVIATTRWNDIRMAQQPLIGTRIELRLNDPADSVVGRKLAQTIRAEQAGRALIEGGLFAQVALPVLDDVDDAGLGTALEDLAKRSTQSWSGPSAAPIRLLPTDLDPDELPDVLEEPERVPLGLRQDTMEAAYFDLTRESHLLLLGDSGSGKSTALRGILDGLRERYSEEELVIAVMDVRGALEDVVPDDYLGGRATTSIEARALAAAVAEELAARQAGDRRSGPRIVVVADDYDIVASGGTDPLAPLMPYLPSARDLRLSVLITRPVAGSSRAMYDPVLQTLRDTGGSVLVMSGERSEGQILPRVYAEQMTAGRGRYVRRGEAPRIIQIAHFGAMDAAGAAAGSAASTASAEVRE
ncbi:MAG: type VII secretion protein EccCa [Naasia sp.]